MAKFYFNKLTKTFLTGIIVWLVFSTSCFSQSFSRQYNDLSQTYGYIIGQNNTLSIIEAEFPNLRSEVMLAKLEFDLSFSVAKTNIENELKDVLGSNFNNFISNIKQQGTEVLKSQKVTEQLAIEFIRKVKRRAKGDIESPIIETLLTYQYVDNPVDEFLDDFYFTFSTKEHPKSKGLNINFKLPFSWSMEEANRPNIIQNFQSQNGTGGEMIQILIRDLPLPNGYKFTESDINELYSEGVMKTMLPNGGKLIEAKKIRIDNNIGGQLVFEQKLQRLDDLIKMRVIQYSTIVDTKMVMLLCSVSGKPDENLESRFGKYYPLFKQVANSIVFIDQY